MVLQRLPGEFAIVKLDPAASIPDWATGREFVSITRTPEELSIVHETTGGEWRCLKVQGPLEFSLVGVLASLADPLARAGVPIFAISSYDTDHILVKAGNLERAIGALRGAGHKIT